jgi:hypothetical protein
MCCKPRPAASSSEQTLNFNAGANFHDASLQSKPKLKMLRCAYQFLNRLEETGHALQRATVKFQFQIMHEMAIAIAKFVK